MLLLLTLLASTVNAQTAQQCQRVEFSGEASQTKKFNLELGQHITFTVFPMSYREEPRWRWFQIRIIGSDSVFVFSPSDHNWLLAANFRSAFIGGPNSDVKKSLQYNIRYLVFPLSVDQKVELLYAVSNLSNASTQDERGKAVAEFQALRLGQLKFVIDDYLISGGEPPTSIDSVKFSGTLTLPPDFQLAGLPSVTFVDCPAIPNEVIENVRNPKRHEYLLPQQKSQSH